MRKITGTVNKFGNCEIYHECSQGRGFHMKQLKFLQFGSICGYFGHIVTADAEKRLFLSFRLKF